MRIDALKARFSSMLFEFSSKEEILASELNCINNFTSVIAMLLRFFNDFLGLIGAAFFYPSTVYIPIEMVIGRAKTPKFSFTWVWLKILSWVCLIVSIVAAAGSVEGLITDLKTYRPKTYNSVKVNVIH
ncbi:hypothetical protein DCAR_0831187 [Daucus carota subsp. sativus]|uniref:Amino acid transporter transmembrane domain-containing protein n=1 Tax=Daucus carota subsp. sativus TaxID=79200 RepID=A0A175YLC3_DAUCS|nr:hypothetical protein DCAR_0831187 [Daucus carota subsp. sativus]